MYDIATSTTYGHTSAVVTSRVNRGARGGACARGGTSHVRHDCVLITLLFQA